jgi:IS30 family transposase
VVRERLEDWSPEQIAVWLKRTSTGEPSMQVSRETICRTIYLAGRRELGPKPGKHLRSGRTVRRARSEGSHGRAGSGTSMGVDP